MSRYPLTLVGVVLLVVVLVVAALLLNTNEQGQRFTIIVGVVATTITALLALLRTEQTAKNAEVVKDAVIADKGTVKVALDKIQSDIAENTALSKQAFTEANNFTERLTEQGRQFDALLGAAIGRLPDPSLMIDTHDRVVDTNEKVTEVRDRVVDG